MMFADTSAIVAILTDEPERKLLSGALSRGGGRTTSPIVRLETSIVLARRLDIDPVDAEELFKEFLEMAAVSVIQINDPIAISAVEAPQKYGRGRHPATLNFADCLSYACAKAFRTTLLYKGKDFSQTDIKAAVRA